MVGYLLNLTTLLTGNYQRSVTNMTSRSLEL